MYPRISDLFPELFGFHLPFPIYSYGFMVAVAVLVGMRLAGRELDRLYQAGRIGGVRVPSENGPAKETSPSVLIGTVAVLAVVVGFAGARLFFILENLDDFARHPLAMIFSPGGFTFYGGLLVAIGFIGWYLHRKELSIPVFADALAPSLILGYGIGRLGCHIAGDGDWGIPADMSLKPEGLPTWLWAETYPNDILGAEIVPPGVYPTSIYEFVAAALIFGLLWAVRKHPFKGGWLFSLYLVLGGIERFLIEKIRVNPEYDLLGLTVTQAEVIAALLVLIGIVGLTLTWKRRSAEPERREKHGEVTPTPA
jgi:phosphatidylglycerol:prolipoprotein diacylglycerol transferase